MWQRTYSQLKRQRSRGQVTVSSMIPRNAAFHSLCTRNPVISVIIWYKPRDYASTRRPSPTNVNTGNKPNTNPIPINQSARSRRRRLSAKSCRDRVKNTSIKNSLKWAYVRGALRPALALISATSRTNLNLTPPLYTSPERAAHRAGPPPSRSYPRLAHSRRALLYLSPSPWNLATLKIQCVLRRGAGRGTQSAGRTCANKIDFLSPRWRFVTSLFTSAREVWTLDLWRTTVTQPHSDL